MGRQGCLPTLTAETTSAFSSLDCPFSTISLSSTSSFGFSFPIVSNRSNILLFPSPFLPTAKNGVFLITPPSPFSYVMTESRSRGERVDMMKEREDRMTRVRRAVAEEDESGAWRERTRRRSRGVWVVEGKTLEIGGDWGKPGVVGDAFGQLSENGELRS
jgi:hypothetical protein